MNSRDKGKRGEREFRDVLREAGYCKAYRGQQFKGGNESPDVVCPEIPSIHWEVKRCEKGNPYDWVDQAEADMKYPQLPVVAHKRNNCEWLAIVPMRDFLRLVSETGRIIGVAAQTPFFGDPGGRPLDCVGVSNGNKGKADTR